MEAIHRKSTLLTAFYAENRRSVHRIFRNLPSGVGVLKSVNGHGSEFWRVRLGKRFTGDSVQKKDFRSLLEARKWIFGDKLHIYLPIFLQAIKLPLSS
jgi:hypothetical protein